MSPTHCYNRSCKKHPDFGHGEVRSQAILVQCYSETTVRYVNELGIAKTYQKCGAMKVQKGGAKSEAPEADAEEDAEVPLLGA